MPECYTCAAKEEHIQLMRSDFLTQMKHLENTIAHERKQTALLQEKLFMAVRLESRNQISYQGNPVAVVGDKQTQIRGVVSPMKQRATAEADSRQKYWKNKAQAIESAQPVEGLISKTEG